jgi:hypothetical protein
VIPTGQHLEDLIEEIADWTVTERRAYISSIEREYGEDEAKRLKDALTEYWKNR